MGFLSTKLSLWLYFSVLHSLIWSNRMSFALGTNGFTFSSLLSVNMSIYISLLLTRCLDFTMTQLSVDAHFSINFQVQISVKMKYLRVHQFSKWNSLYAWGKKRNSVLSDDSFPCFNGFRNFQKFCYILYSSRHERGDRDEHCAFSGGVQVSDARSKSCPMGHLSRDGRYSRHNQNFVQSKAKA